MTDRSRDGSRQVAVRSSKRARTAAGYRWDRWFEVMPTLDDEGDLHATFQGDPAEDEDVGTVKCTMPGCRRWACAYWYSDVMGAPPKAEWVGTQGVPGAISICMTALHFPANSRRLVRHVFEQVHAATARGDQYDAFQGYHSSGRTATIEEDSIDAHTLIQCFENGMSITQIAIQVNEVREARESDCDPVSWACVQRWIESKEYLSLAKRGVKKSGKSDLGTQWAKGRVGQAKEWDRRLELGDGGATPTPDDAGLTPLYTKGIAWWDEHHKKVRLGHSSKYEGRVARDAQGNPCSPADGGVYPACKPTTSMKYPGEARGCFGVAVVELLSGETEGRRMAPFWYTGCTVVGLTRWGKAQKAELARVKSLAGCWGKKGDGKGYLERWPENVGNQNWKGSAMHRWEWELDAKLRGPGKLCPIIDLMAHVFKESERIYTGTTHESDFMVFHDALSAWWEKKAQVRPQVLRQCARHARETQLKKLTNENFLQHLSHLARHGRSGWRNLRAGNGSSVRCFARKPTKALAMSASLSVILPSCAADSTRTGSRTSTTWSRSKLG